eukprot:CAMPEP_0119273938 /NCGR_PEP_ID=MMETSP1329-20130426/11167_1 /TAXON_ID=114041 /ORGANISM="Genus nov. species nov., Strain RCC1024" /LENGTH=202 /DNA_ID=CAMNT_0007274199 /DNA_START=169 /DNA_END=774 /DNA_ORIENTATION=-
MVLPKGHAEDIPECREKEKYETPLDILRIARPETPSDNRLTIRIWRFPIPLHVYHSYIGGTSEMGGMSDRLPTVLPLDPERTTFASLRSPIETWNNDGMLRRTALFQELLAVMIELDNVHDYPPADALQYRFGVWPLDDYENYPPGTVPTIIPREREEDLVAAWITDPLTQDLLLVPQTQVNPSDTCTLVRCAGDEECKEGS